ncbi:MAG TPA: DUF4112 domain-containing protein [Gemmataceae bacterium]|jgi:hypothetical protein|nr:DUF4112 domain-containing protein [Gemmataceae bacterium]
MTDAPNPTGALVPAPRIIIKPAEAAPGPRPDVELVRKLAWLMDQAVEVPGTRFRVGVDALIGLLPGIGDLISTAIGGYIVMVAARAGVPRPVIHRMLLNLGVDAILGAVPFAGDLFDAAWRANSRNARLLETALEDPARARRSSVWMLVGVTAAVAALAAGVTLLAVWGIRRLTGS